MRVLHVLHNSLPLLCGYSVRSGYIVRGQRDRGIEPVVVTSPQNPDPEARTPEAMIDGIRHYRTALPAGSAAPLVREWRLMRAFQKRIEDVVRRERPSIIHAHSPVLVGLPALRAARKAGLPFVYEVRDIWENASVDRGKFRSGSPLYRLARGMESRVLRRADAVVCICQTLRDELQARARTRVHVVDNGVDTTGFSPITDTVALKQRWDVTNRRVVAYVGTFQPYEGLELLTEAMRTVAIHLPEACLLIAGGSADPNGPVEERLRAVVDRFGLGNVVRFLGRLPHARVHEVYAIADVVVYPRILTRTTALTTPLKPLEAMAMGKAVAASDLPALRELVVPEHTGILFKAGDVADLSAACVRLLQDPQLRTRLGTQAQAWTRRERSWPHLIERYLGVYEQLVQSPITGGASAASGNGAVANA
jgi:PEP-CTERM/exosortase A-associated glycosyltransferase